MAMLDLGASPRIGKLADLVKFDATQRRDQGGKWTSGGGSNPSGESQSGGTTDHAPINLTGEKPSRNDLRAQYARIMPKLAEKKSAVYEKLNKLFGGTNAVSARVKFMESALGKMERRGIGAHELHDVVGARVTAKNYADLKQVADRIRKEFPVTSEEDMTLSPRSDGYRGLHFNVDLGSGLTGEIQVRTKRQDKWADWSHDRIYKSLEGAQNDIAKNRAAIDAYATKMSDYYAALDSGADPKLIKEPPRSFVVDKLMGNPSTYVPERTHLPYDPTGLICQEGHGHLSTNPDGTLSCEHCGQVTFRGEGGPPSADFKPRVGEHPRAGNRPPVHAFQQNTGDPKGPYRPSYA